MNTLKVLVEAPSMFVEREEKTLSIKEVTEEKVVSFYKSSVKYASLPLEEKWKYRKAVNELQVLINKIQQDELNNIEGFEVPLPEVVKLLQIRKEMLTVK